MDACCFHLFVPRRSWSALTGNPVQIAKRRAPPAAEKTEKSRGAFTPRATAIVTPKRVRRIPLSRAAVRVCHPITRKRPNKPSAHVAMMARAGIKPSGKNQVSFPMYITNRAKVPQDTLGRPKAPNNPNRSARAERKDRPRASHDDHRVVRLPTADDAAPPDAEVVQAVEVEDWLLACRPEVADPLELRHEAHQPRGLVRVTGVENRAAVDG